MHAISVISRNLKLGGGGIDKCLGGVSKRKAHIYTKKHDKREKTTLNRAGGGSKLGGGSLSPQGGV